MRVKVLFFAASRDIVGRSEVDVELPADVDTIGAFLAHLTRSYPDLDGRLGSVRIAQNERFADHDSALSAGDVLAVIPPVAGG